MQERLHQSCRMYNTGPPADNPTHPAGDDKRARKFVIPDFRAIFVSDLVPDSSAKSGIKRESGANPGQSRCCEAPPRSEILTATDRRTTVGKASEQESVRRPAISIRRRRHSWVRLRHRQTLHLLHFNYVRPAADASYTLRSGVQRGRAFTERRGAQKDTLLP